MSDTDVSQLFRQAIDQNDPTAMREGIERLFGIGGPGVSAEAEYLQRHEDYVMEMPQSGERIRGRDAMRAMQETFPGPPPSITLRRIVGSGRVWVVEAVNDYGGDVWPIIVVLEFDADGLILRDTRYYAKPFDAPEWRAEWAEDMATDSTDSGNQP